MKIATKFYLVAAASMAAVLVNVAIDIHLWRQVHRDNHALHEKTARQKQLVDDLQDRLNSLSARLRANPRPDPAEWSGLPQLGDFTLASLHQSLLEINALEYARHRESVKGAPHSLARLDSGAQALAATWGRLVALPPAASDLRDTALRTQLLPGIEDVLAPAQELENHLLSEHARTEQAAARTVAQERNPHLFSTALLVLTILLGIVLLHQRLIHPLAKITREADAVARGEHFRIDSGYSREDELSSLTHSINAMIDQLRSAAFSRTELGKLVAQRTADLRERERELSESRALLQRALAGSQLAVWEWIVPTGHVEFSVLCTEILGYAPGKIGPTLEAWQRLVHPDDLPRVTTARTAHLDGATPEYRAEIRMRTRAGDWRWIRTAGRVAERDDAGRPRRVSGTHADIHAEKTAQLQLQRRDEQLALALAASDSVLWDVDLATRTVSLDERWPLIVGGPPGPRTVTIRDLFHLVPREERGTTLRAFADVRDGRAETYAIEHRVRHADGSFRWVRSRGRCVARGPDGKATRLIGINADITALQQSAAAAARQAELYAAINKTALDLLAHRGSADVLQALVDRASTLLDAEIAEVALLEGGMLVSRAQHGPLPLDRGRPVGREAVLSWQAIDTRQPAIVDDYDAYPHARAHFRALGVRAVAIFPIIHADRVSGVLGLRRQRRDHPFTLDDLQKGQLLARLAALALRNASIYEHAVHLAEVKTAALRESEERFQLANRATFEVIWDQDLATGRIWWNENFQPTYGHAPAAFSDDSSAWKAHLHPEDRDRVVAGVLRTLADPAALSWQDTYRFRRTDDSYAFAEDRAYIVRDSAGRAIRLLGAMRDVTARKLAEEALRVSETHYRTLVESVTQGYYVADHRGFFTYCNPALHAMGGYAAGSLVGRSSFRFIHDDDRPRVLAEYKRLAADPTVVTARSEFRVRTRDGRPFWVEQTTDFVRAADGRVTSGRNILHDIDARKAAEHALAETNASLRAIFEQCPAVITVTDYETGATLRVNDAAESVFGLPPRECLGKTGPELGVWVDLAERNAIRAQLTATGRDDNRRVTMRRHDGRQVEILQNARLIELDGRRVVLDILLDITERKRAEDALALETAKLRAIFEQSPALISLTTLPEGRFVQVNDAATRIFGHTLEEMAGRTGPELGFWVDLAQREKIVDELARTGRAENHEVTMRRKDGSLLEIDYSARRIMIGGVPHSLNILVDITARKQTERNLADSLREKETLLREIHHRVKNNLQIISSLLHFQSKKIAGAGESAVFSDAQNRLRAMVLVHEKLYRSDDLHRINLGEYLRGLAEQLRRSFHGADRITLAFSTAEVPAPVEIALPCGMLVTELVTNAIKHAYPDGGSGEVRVALALEDGVFTLAIADQGAGFPPGFDPRTADSFGWKLIAGLVGQLGGRYALGAAGATAPGAGPGARIVITFPQRAASATVSPS